jgi:hypothetical protein
MSAIKVAARLVAVGLVPAVVILTVAVGLGPVAGRAVAAVPGMGPAGAATPTRVATLEMEAEVVGRQARLTADQLRKVTLVLAANQAEREEWEKTHADKLAYYRRLIGEAMQAVESDVAKTPISDLSAQEVALRRLTPMTAGPRDQVRPLVMEWIALRQRGEAAVAAALAADQQAAWQGYVLWRETTEFGLFQNVPLTAEQIEKCRPPADDAAAKLAVLAQTRAIAGEAAAKARQEGLDALAAQVRTQVLTAEQRALADRFQQMTLKIKDATEGPCSILIKECKLSAEQQAAVRTRTEARDKAMAEWKRTEGGGLEALRAAMVLEWGPADETAVNVLEADRQRILFDCYTGIDLDVLTPPQRLTWRVYQGTLQMIMRLAPALNVTADQEARVRQAMATYYNAVAAIEGTGPEAIASRNGARRRAEATVRSVLAATGP